jgi:hypothetical protein
MISRADAAPADVYTPLYLDVFTCLRRPFVHGLETYSMTGVTLQSASLDTNRKQQSFPQAGRQRTRNGEKT